LFWLAVTVVFVVLHTSAIHVTNPPYFFFGDQPPLNWAMLVPQSSIRQPFNGNYLTPLIMQSVQALQHDA